jgi:FlaA1/EpsC-like NDP-sugar epimerase
VSSVRFDSRRLLVGVWYAAATAASFVAAMLLRYDFAIPAHKVPLLWRALAIALPVKVSIFYLTGLHRRVWWRFADIVDLYRVFVANVLASLGFAVIDLVIYLDLIRRGIPHSVYGVDFLVSLMLLGGIPLAYRIYWEIGHAPRSRTAGKGILIYGAGVAGTMLVREIRAKPQLGYKVIGFLDDDPKKRDAVLMDVPVLGTGRDVVRIVDRYKRTGPKVDELIIAMPSVATHELPMREVLANCRTVGVPCKTVPTLGELLSGKVRIGQIRDLSPADLLGREPVLLDEPHIRADITGRKVLVTGAAGSIGSELCLQIARFEPGLLVALDQAESGLFTIELELRRKFPTLEMISELADVRDASRVDEVMRRHAVELVFHAAAYKHVPVMESHVLEAVKTNVFGTWNVVQSALRHHVATFLMISSDKAVNPTSVMGATKRVAELIVSAMPFDGAGGRTKFVSVRFGNVLGSSGSVVPIFLAQIASGGPVTVTHPEACRFFMTLREAVQLVLQASTMGHGSEIFVLDMGEPIHIVDLARNMIQLSGLVPDRDIEIRFVGLRPGEKIREELLSEGEDLLPTHHSKIRIFAGPRVPLDTIETWVGRLQDLVAQRDVEAVIAHLKTLVPEYRPATASSGAKEVEDTRRPLPVPALTKLAGRNP